MKYLGKTYSNSIFSDVACLNGVKEADPKCTLGIDGRNKRSWSSFIIRNDFGFLDERHDVVDVWPTSMRMV